MYILFSNFYICFCEELPEAKQTWCFFVCSGHLYCENFASISAIFIVLTDQYSWVQFVFKNLQSAFRKRLGKDCNWQWSMVDNVFHVLWCWREFLFFPWQRPHFEVTSCMCVTELVCTEELFQNNIMLSIYTYVCVRTIPIIIPTWKIDAT